MTGNPHYAWDAYASCRFNDQVIPEWVLECFDLAAYNLRDLMHDPPVDPATAVAAAMEMLPSKGPSVFWAYNKTSYRLLSYVEAVLRHQAAGDKTEHAIKAAAAEKGVSESTIRRAWRAYCQSVAETVTVKT